MAVRHDVGSSQPGAEVGPKGWAVRPLKRYRSQGFGCSPIKVVRELGSERRETVSPKGMAVRHLKWYASWV